MKPQVPECIKDYGKIKNPFHAGLLTTLLVGKFSGAVTLLLLGQHVDQHLPPEIKEQMIDTNTAWFLSGLTTGISSWVYYRMPKRLDDTIESKIKPWIKNKLTQLLS